MNAQEAARLLNYAFLIFPPMVVIFMIANVWYLKRIGGILKQLEQRHPAAWEALGKLTVFKNNSPGNNRKLLRFLYKREFNSLDDNEIKAECESVRRMLLVLASVEGAFVILFLILFIAGTIIKPA